MTRSSPAPAALVRAHWSLVAVMAVYLVTLAFMPQRGL